MIFHFTFLNYSLQGMGFERGWGDSAQRVSEMVYILDQVRALENEMVSRIQKQGLDVTPKILIVSIISLLNSPDRNIPYFPSYTFT